MKKYEDKNQKEFFNGFFYCFFEQLLSFGSIWYIARNIIVSFMQQNALGKNVDHVVSRFVVFFGFPEIPIIKKINIILYMPIGMDCIASNNVPLKL